MSGSLVTHTAEGVMAAGARLLPISRLRGKVLILTYHDILARGVPSVRYDPLRLPVERFEEQLDIVRDSFEVIGLVSALSGDRGPKAEPAVVITFDDAYVGAVRHGVDALQKRGLPATIFVAPEFCSGRRFWWDGLADADAEAPSREQREYALTELKGRTDNVERWAQAQGIAFDLPSDTCRAATEVELRSALAHEGLTIGSHTWNHPNLAVLSDSEIRSELILSLSWIRRFGAQAVPYVAYPYGLSSARARELAAASGYVHGLELGGGWFSAQSTDPFRVPRRNIPAAVSRAGFSLRLAGFPRS